MQSRQKKRTKRESVEDSKAKRVKKLVFDIFEDPETHVKEKPNLRNKTAVAYHDCQEEKDKSDSEISPDICIICGEFGKNWELWLRCVYCAEWAHKACTDGETKKTFVCDYCQ